MVIEILLFSFFIFGKKPRLRNVRIWYTYAHGVILFIPTWQLCFLKLRTDGRVSQFFFSIFFRRCMRPKQLFESHFSFPSSTWSGVPKADHVTVAPWGTIIPMVLGGPDFFEIIEDKILKIQTKFSYIHRMAEPNKIWTGFWWRNGWNSIYETFLVAGFRRGTHV